jgi:hypothetical protein
MNEVWVFSVGEYEDHHLIGPFATEELAQKAFEVYKKFELFFSKPTYKVVPWTILDEKGTDDLIAKHMEEYGDL